MVSLKFKINMRIIHFYSFFGDGGWERLSRFCIYVPADCVQVLE